MSSVISQLPNIYKSPDPRSVSVLIERIDVPELLGDTVTAGELIITNAAEDTSVDTYLVINGDGVVGYRSVSSSGVNTLGVIGNTPNAYGATLNNSGVITLQPASGTFGGVLTSTDQTIGGGKTFADYLVVQGITVAQNDVIINGNLSVSGNSDTNINASLLVHTTATGAEVYGPFIAHDNITALGSIETGSSRINTISNQLVLGPTSTRSVTITAPTPATVSRTMTIPDVSANASFVLTEGDQTINGVKTFTSGIATTNTSTAVISATSANNQIVLGPSVGNLTTINSPTPASISQVITIPDVGSNAEFVLTAGAQTIGGAKTFSGTTVLNGSLTANSGISTTSLITSGNAAVGGTLIATGAFTTNSTLSCTSAQFTATSSQIGLGPLSDNVVYISASAPATTSRIMTIPDVASNASFVLTAGAQTIGGVKTFSSAPVISTISNTGALTLPTSTDTLIGRATTDTLTNKTISTATNTVTVGGTNINSLLSQAVLTTSDVTFDVLSATNLILDNASTSVTDIVMANVIKNKRIMLHGGAGNNEHQFYGFGINGSTLRYQVDQTASDHVFYAGASSVASNEVLRVKGTGGILLPTSGGTASVLDYYETYTHSSTFTCGGTTTGSFNAILTRIDNMIFVRMPAFTMAYSSAGTITMNTVLPARFRPFFATSTSVPVYNATSHVFGVMLILTTGAVIISAGVVGTNFTSGTIGLINSVTATCSAV